MTNSPMEDSDIRVIATEVLKNAFGNLGFINAEALSELDFDGTPIIRVRAHFEREPEAADDSPLEAAHEIRGRLLEKGEDRLVFIENSYDNEHVFEQEDGE